MTAEAAGQGKQKQNKYRDRKGRAAHAHYLHYVDWLLCTRFPLTLSRAPRKAPTLGPPLPFLSHKPTNSFLLCYYTPYPHKMQRVLSTWPIGTVLFSAQSLPDSELRGSCYGLNLHLKDKRSS